MPKKVICAICAGAICMCAFYKPVPPKDQLESDRSNSGRAISIAMIGTTSASSNTATVYVTNTMIGPDFRAEFKAEYPFFRNPDDKT